MAAREIAQVDAALHIARVIAGPKRVNQDRIVTHVKTISFYKSADNKILKREDRTPDRTENFQIVIAANY